MYGVGLLILSFEFWDESRSVSKYGVYTPWLHLVSDALRDMDLQQTPYLLNDKSSRSLDYGVY